jgi:hypothetical protein
MLQLEKTWPAAACDLRDSMQRAGLSEAIIERVLAAIARPFAAAIELGTVDDELLWALVAVQGEIFRRAGAGLRNTLASSTKRDGFENV